VKAFLKLISFVGLALTVGPAFLVFAGWVTWDRYATWMLVGMLLWFLSAPFWMKRHREGSMS
jgi:thiosulfate reductase cytochrome b subunit